jgi:hypothetical protein
MELRQEIQAAAAARLRTVSHNVSLSWFVCCSTCPGFFKLYKMNF